MTTVPIESRCRRPIPKHLLAAFCIAVLAVSCTGVPETPCYGPPPVPYPQGVKTLQERNRLIDWLSKFAIREQESSRIPASITIAQAILETGWLRMNTPERRRMILDAKNLFGIKGTGPAGSVEIMTREHINGKMVSVRAKFRAYHSYAESFEDHTRLLTKSRYYRGALKYVGDPRRFIREVARHYATDPDYADKIWSIVTRYNLTRFDSFRENM